MNLLGQSAMAPHAPRRCTVTARSSGWFAEHLPIVAVGAKLPPHPWVEVEVDCGICMEPIQLDDRAQWTLACPGEHVYHRDCLRSWFLRRDTTCPECRVRPNERVLLQLDLELRPRSGDEIDPFHPAQPLGSAAAHARDKATWAAVLAVARRPQGVFDDVAFDALDAWIVTVARADYPAHNRSAIDRAASVMHAIRGTPAHRAAYSRAWPGIVARASRERPRRPTLE